MALLEIRNLSKYFGGLAAVRDLDLQVFDSEILGLIGPNGAGKTTLFNVVSGFYLPTSGKVMLKGEGITGLRADQIAQRGIGRTFQASTLFMQLTVFDNVLSGFHKHYGQPGWKAFLHSPAARKEEMFAKQRAMEILEFMELASLKNELAGNLPHGYQRTLGVCVALATEAELLLLDEPMTGMNPSETLDMIRKIEQIQEKGTTIVIVEHDMRAVMNLCNRIVVLNYGRKIAEGSPEEIRENEEVIEAYLGRRGILDVP